jgi:hypothetical protein
MGPKCEDPMDPGVDLRIVLLGEEGTVGAARPRVHPHCHRPSPEWLNAAIDEGPLDIHTYQPGLEQLLNNVVKGL